MAKLELSTEFKALTEQEQVFVQAYLYGESAGNASASALKAYNVKPELSAQLGHKTLNRPRVQAAIAFGRGLDLIPDSEFWSQLKRALLQDESWQVKMTALRLIAEIKGFVTGKNQMSGNRKGKAEINESSVIDELSDRISKMPVGRIIEAMKEQ